VCCVANRDDNLYYAVKISVPIIKSKSLSSNVVGVQMMLKINAVYLSEPSNYMLDVVECYISLTDASLLCLSDS